MELIFLMHLDYHTLVVLGLGIRIVEHFVSAQARVDQDSERRFVQVLQPDFIVQKLAHLSHQLFILHLHAHSHEQYSLLEYLFRDPFVAPEVKFLKLALDAVIQVSIEQFFQCTNHFFEGYLHVVV